MKEKDIASPATTPAPSIANAAVTSAFALKATTAFYRARIASVATNPTKPEESIQ
jgi:hypothetical protein